MQGLRFPSHIAFLFALIPPSLVDELATQRPLANDVHTRTLRPLLLPLFGGFGVLGLWTCSWSVFGQFAEWWLISNVRKAHELVADPITPPPPDFLGSLN